MFYLCGQVINPKKGGQKGEKEKLQFRLSKF
jgi:hypothetical protein